MLDLGSPIKPGNPGAADRAVDEEIVFTPDARGIQLGLGLKRQKFRAQAERERLGKKPRLPAPAFCRKIVRNNAEPVVARRGRDGVQLFLSFMKRANRSNR